MWSKICRILTHFIQSRFPHLLAVSARGWSRMWTTSRYTNRQTKYGKVLFFVAISPVLPCLLSISSHMTHLQNICSPTTCWSSSSWSSTASSPPPSSSLSSPGLGVQPTLPPSKMRRGKLPSQVLKRNNEILKHKSLVRSRGDPCPAVRCHRHRLHPLLLIGGSRGGCLLGIIVNIHYTRLI